MPKGKYRRVRFIAQALQHPDPGHHRRFIDFRLATETEDIVGAIEHQQFVTIEYKGFTREEPLRCDLLIENCLLVEAKSVEKILPIHKAQLLSYMKLLNVPVGLLINFHELKVTDGISRLILPGANL